MDTNKLMDECFLVDKALHSIVGQNIDEILGGKGALHLPKFSHSLVKDLCVAASNRFKEEPIVLELNKPCIVVGDIHGHLLDLLRIWNKFCFPPYQNYMFLGDLIDRGEFSLETVVAIYAMKILYPENVHIIRGNHEFLNSSNSSVLVAEEIEAMYPRQNVYKCLIDSFDNLPVAAILYGNILCIHGGISPELVSINQIKSLKRPITDYNDSPILNGLLWSDPTTQAPEFSASRRKSGFLFGPVAFNNFMQTNSLKLMIRGHECVKNGYLELFDKQLITVFSASNYCGTSGNKSAVLSLHENGYDPLTMLPMEYIKRTSCVFLEVHQFNKHFSRPPLPTPQICNTLINPNLPILKISQNGRLNRIYRNRPRSLSLRSSASVQITMKITALPEQRSQIVL